MSKKTSQLDLNLILNNEVCDNAIAFEKLKKLGHASTKRTAQRRLQSLEIWPDELSQGSITDEHMRPLIEPVFKFQIEQARSKRKLVLFVQLHSPKAELHVLHANSARGDRYWVCVENPLSTHSIEAALMKLQQHVQKQVRFFPHASIVLFFRQSKLLVKDHSISAYREIENFKPSNIKKQSQLPPHLAHLEAESIFIFREAVAQSKNPVLLYSIGKDSTVMLELAKKAFYPGKLPFPLMHIDSKWEFQTTYRFRDYVATDPAVELITYINPKAIEQKINPFEHGSEIHTEITRTSALKQAIDHYQFDAIFGGARRDEEKSRAKERIFSFRFKNHRWDPKNQRPELWNLFNARIHPNESIRIFPLSNWTELDIWQYIYLRGIAVVPLYFAQTRPIVRRNNLLLMVDDERFQLQPNEMICDEIVRFRTLGCYPLTGAIESKAQNVEEIILELIHTRQSERQGRAIDFDPHSNMEKKKVEGYF